MNVNIVPKIEETDSFVVFSDQNPDLPNFPEWFWNFDPNELPNNLHGSNVQGYNKVWIKVENTNALDKLFELIPNISSFDRCYLPRSFYKKFRGQNWNVNSLYLFNA